jgi:hypothetical protein
MVTVEVVLLPATTLAGVVALIVKLGAVDVTVRLMVVVSVSVPSVPDTVTVDVPAGVLDVVEIVKMDCPLPPSTVGGTNAQVAPVGRPVVQLRVTSPVYPFTGVTVTVEVVVLPAATLVGAVAERVNPGVAKGQACASAYPSIEPHPVTWS